MKSRIHVIRKGILGLSISFLIPFTISAGEMKDRQTYATPEEAMAALAEAARKDDRNSLDNIFGPQGGEIVSSGDPVKDSFGRETFAHLYDEKHSLERVNDSQMEILVGREEWPFPIRIVKSEGKWAFDTANGREEILNRRIGQNELRAIALCGFYVEAQKDYHSRDGVTEYAQAFISDHNRKNGLFWPRRAGETASPLGPVVAQGVAEGYSSQPSSSPRPFHGYFFRILKEQGPHAPGGKKTYMKAGGRMTEGFALVAYPVTWGVTGIMTFIVGEDGKIYQKNLGPGTAEEASALKAYDPDSGWELVQG